jgi:hypothetical protein
MEKSDRIADLRAEIWTRYFQNTKQKYQLLGFDIRGEGTKIQKKSFPFEFLRLFHLYEILFGPVIKHSNETWTRTVGDKWTEAADISTLRRLGR